MNDNAKNAEGTSASADTAKHHRKRMRDRIADHGTESLVPYELLEVMLYAVIPRRDTKPIAKALLKRFKTFKQMFAADINELSEIDGIGRDSAIFIKVVAQTLVRVSEEKVKSEDSILRSWDSVINFLEVKIGLNQNESFIALFLDSKNAIIHHEILAEGTVNRVAIFPREIVKAALKHNAVSVIIAHNHPSGDTTPSQQDITMTNAIQDALKTIDIKLHDHIIITKSDHESFKNLGLL